MKTKSVILVTVIGFLLSSCYIGPGSPLLSGEDADIHVYPFYQSDTLSESDVVKVMLGDADKAIIDGVTVSKQDYQEIHLGPGVHEVRWNKTFGFSVMVEPSMMGQFSKTGRIKMKPGHVYKLRADRTHGHGYKVFLWIEDVRTGEVVYGDKKP